MTYENDLPIERKEKGLKADIALFFGPAVTHFEQVYCDKQGNVFAATDIETNDRIIVVTLREENMDEAMRRCHFINNALYQGAKSLHLFAPNYTDQVSIDYLTAELGVQFVRSIQEIVST